MPGKRFGGVVQEFRNYKEELLAVLISLVTLAGERSIEAAVFRCPCDPIRRQEYAALFMSMPIIILLVVGVAFNLKVWKLITGCCNTKTCGDKGCYSCFCCKNFFKILGFALVAPIVWLVLTLIDGDYLACATTSIAYLDFENIPCKPVSASAGIKQGGRNTLLNKRGLNIKNRIRSFLLF